jgi:hypothetical protein
MSQIPKGLYVNYGVFTYNPFGIKVNDSKLAYKHIFPSGMSA